MWEVSLYDALKNCWKSYCLKFWHRSKNVQTKRIAETPMHRNLVHLIRKQGSEQVSEHLSGGKEYETGGYIVTWCRNRKDVRHKAARNSLQSLVFSWSSLLPRALKWTQNNDRLWESGPPRWEPQPFLILCKLATNPRVAFCFLALFFRI